MKNVLKDIGDTFINAEKKIIKLDLTANYNNKSTIYGLLFLTYYHPSYTSIISNLIDFYNKTNNQSKKFEIIYCSCDETEAEFTQSIQNHPWLILPYNPNTKRNELILSHNVLSVPLLVIIDQDGKKIVSLNKSEIDSIDDNSYSGWVNMSSLNDKLLKIEKYVIGQKGVSICHPHNLIYTDYTLKSPEYRDGSWSCDECGKDFKPNVCNFYCGLCGYDICNACYEKNK